MATESVTTSQNRNLMAALSYLFGFITGIIFLLIEKKDDFVRFHAMQSTIAFGGLFVFYLFMSFIPIIGWLIALLFWPVCLVAWVILMVKAYQGARFKLPFIGNIAEEQMKKV